MEIIKKKIIGEVKVSVFDNGDVMITDDCLDSVNMSKEDFDNINKFVKGEKDE